MGMLSNFENGKTPASLQQASFCAIYRVLISDFWRWSVNHTWVPYVRTGTRREESPPRDEGETSNADLIQSYPWVYRLFYV